MSDVTKETKLKDKQSFGQRVAQNRKAKGLTQEDLGERIGVLQRIMLHYENKAEYPPAQKTIDLAQALGMSVDELLGIGNDDKDSYQDINPRLAKKLRLVSNLPSMI